MKNKRLLLIGLAAVLAYWQVFLQFFQQDEWHHFGAEIVWHSTPFIDFLKGQVFSFQNIHFAPLTNLVNYLQFSIFGINPLGYAFVALSFHILNAILLFLVFEKVIKDKRTAFLASLLFATSVIPRQAVTWLVQHITTLPALTFSLASVLSAQNYFSTKKSKWFGLSAVFMLVALGFKETALFLGAFLPIYWFITQFPQKKKILFPATILIITIVYSVFRLGTLPKESVGEPLSPSSNLPEKVLFTVASGLAQSFIPEQVVIGAAKNITPIQEETPEYARFINFTLAPKIVLFLAGGLGLAVFWLFFSQKDYRREILIGGAFIIAGSIPLIMVPGAYESGLLASRYLYIPVIGSSLILATALVALAKRNKKPSDMLILLILVLNIFGGGYLSWQETKVGNLRRGILTAITKAYPDLPEDVVFYTESDSTFYGLPESERILPFQSGFGQTLLVNYQNQENFPIDFFEDDFLWEIKDEGYKKVGDRGFGYFRDFDLLIQTIEKSPLLLDSVISFRYDFESGLVYDNTQEVRGRVEGYFANHRPVSGFKVLSSLNPEEAFLANDGSRETFWDSKLPYSRPQFVEIDIGRARKVAHITIDSYNNVDQNEVGYRAEVSQDGASWEQVFYAERYLPDPEEYVNLYFKPKTVRYIRLYQAGSHDYASWVIHELGIYEKID